MTIERAIAALEADQHEAALDELLAAWRAARHPDLAAAIDELGAVLDPQHARPAGKTVKDKETAWHALAAEGRAASLGVLLATLADVAKAGPLGARIAILARWPADPRIAMKLATMARGWPIPGSTGIASLGAALDLVVAIADPRAFAVLEELQRENRAEYTPHATRSWLRAALERWLAQIRVRGEADAAASASAPAPALLARLRSLVAPHHATPRAADATSLYAAVYADPDDDAARVVLADFLQERGDPRGELIALQLAGTTTAPQRARVAALLRTHAREWLGPIEPAIKKSGLVYERGFVAKCAVKPSSAIVGMRLLDEPAWATIVELDARSWPVAADRAATSMPALRRLVGVGRLPAHPRLEHVALATFDRDTIESLREACVPSLRSLTVDTSYLDLDRFAPFWTTSTASQIETLAIEDVAAARWLVDLGPRLGTDRLASVTVGSGYPRWRFTLTADGVLRCRDVSSDKSPLELDRAAEILEALPASLVVRVEVETRLALTPRMTAAIARFTG